jgi:hypothetical protein
MIKIDTKKAFSAGLGPASRVAAWLVAFAAVVSVCTCGLFDSLLLPGMHACIHGLVFIFEL